jgi:glutaconyl-CoA/methylmalonyl-CoA decarboxylase subunit delta
MKTDWSLLLQEGAIVSLIVIVIIFIIGFILYKFFAGKFLMMILNLRQKLHIQGKLDQTIKEDSEIPPEHSAAIAMAIYLYDKVHDEESTILTIERKSRYYSPWSSKYYNMRKPIHYYRK